MIEGKFKKVDKEKFIEFLNFIAKHAKFEINTQEVINYFKLLSHMQTEILTKIDSNILEIEKVVEANKDKE